MTYKYTLNWVLPKGGGGIWKRGSGLPQFSFLSYTFTVIFQKLPFFTYLVGQRGGGQGLSLGGI